MKTFFQTTIVAILTFSITFQASFAITCSLPIPEGKICDESTHRWVKSQEDIELDVASKNCEPIKDLEARQACHQQVAIDTFKSQYNFDESKKKVLWKVVQYAGMAAQVAMVFMNKKSHCTTASAMMSAGAMGNAVGDIYAWWKHKSLTKTMQRDYEEYANNLTTGDAQYKAFEFLAAEQDIVEEVAKIKGYAQAAAATLYAGAAIAALLEASNTATQAKTKACQAGTEATNKGALLNFFTGPTFMILSLATGIISGGINYLDKQDSKQRRKTRMDLSDTMIKHIEAIGFAAIWSAQTVIDIMVPSASARGDEFSATRNANKAQEVATKSEVTTMDSETKSMYFLAGLATVMGTALGFLSAHSFDVSKTAADRAKKLRKLAADFKIQGTSCSEEENNNGTIPPIRTECYCYKFDAEKNKYVARTIDRRSSKICTRKWYGDDPMNFSLNDYAQDPKLNGKGCLSQGRFDKNCECRKKMDSNGVNACDKTRKNIVQGTSLSSIAGFDSAIGASNNITNGNLGSGNLDPSNLYQTYARTKRAQKMAESAINKKRAAGKKSPITFAALGNKFAVPLIAKASPANKNSAMSGGTGTSSLSSKVSGKTLAKIDAAIKKAGVSLGPKYGASSKRKKKAGKKEDDFDFGLDGMGNAGAGGNKVVDIMGKKFNYKADDIAKRPTKSIFKIITNRYFSSGLRRLFEGDMEESN